MRVFVVEIVEGFKNSFMTRQSEWTLAFVMLVGGWVLLLPFDLYSRSPYYIEFSRWISEQNLGLLFITVGGLRAVVLGLNGSFRPLYHLRAWLSALAMQVWLIMTMAFVSHEQVGMWVAIYPVFVMTEFVNALRAAADAGRNDRRIACAKEAKKAAALRMAGNG